VAAGAYLEKHGRAEFNIPGITFGGRYDGSQAILPDGTQAPPDSANAYTPTACPGGRPPHLWLQDGTSLYDCFGFGWTLLCLGEREIDSTPFVEAMRHCHITLSVVRLADPEVHAAYEAPLVLIRPDQIVAWRGHATAAADDIVQRLLRHDAGPSAVHGAIR
jgi:hypothetical protein